MNKEIEDALHTLLHCSLKDTEYETQIKQYKIVNDYITNLQQENKQLKEEIEEYKRIEQEDLKAINNYDSILTELEKWLKAIMQNASLKWGDNCAREFDLGCLDIEMTMKNYGEVLNKIQELKEKYNANTTN